MQSNCQFECTLTGYKVFALKHLWSLFLVHNNRWNELTRTDILQNSNIQHRFSSYQHFSNTTHLQPSTMWALRIISHIQCYSALTPGLLVGLLPCLFIYFKTTNRCNFRNDTLKMQLIFSSNYITELIAAGFFPGNSGHSMAKERTAQLCQHIATGNEQSGRSTLPKLCVTECMQTTQMW